jgi:hypothetical protein
MVPAQSRGEIDMFNTSIAATGRTALLSAAAALALSAGAATADDFYAGQTIRIIIPFSAGGGTDTFGRYHRAVSRQSTSPATPPSSPRTLPAPAGCWAPTNSPSASIGRRH